MAIVALVALVLSAGTTGAARAQAPIPQWTDAQLDRLAQWLEFARADALSAPVTELPKLRDARQRADRAAIDRVATAAAARLLVQFHQGCCDASLRTGWRIAGSPPPADPAAAVADALENDSLDRLFVSAEPRHPYYRALRRAYAEENDPARRATLAANLDRWRWMPRDLGTRYLLVNAAAFEATLWQGTSAAGRWSVVVGKTKSPTPVFAATITGVTINPWWEIPPSIAAEGVAAMVRRDPAGAARKGYVREGDRYRQRPGPNNALGRMKLVMPNPYSVYLHDTPAQALFGREVRAFSHGCVRVGDALGLAAALLADKAGWDRKAVDAAVANGRTITVPLARPIPVYVAYFTAEPADDGTIRYFPDVYGRDRGLAPASGEPCGL